MGYLKKPKVNTLLLKNMRLHYGRITVVLRLYYDCNANKINAKKLFTFIIKYYKIITMEVIMMIERLEKLNAPKKGVNKKQIASLIDADVIDRLDFFANKMGFGSKRMIIENALTSFLDQLEKK